MCNCTNEMPGTCTGVNNCPMACPDIQDEIDARIGDLTADDMTEVLEMMTALEERDLFVIISIICFWIMPDDVSMIIGTFTREECEAFREALRDILLSDSERAMGVLRHLFAPVPRDDFKLLRAAISAPAERLIEKRLHNDH